MGLKYTDVNRRVLVEFNDGTYVLGRLSGLQFTMGYVDERTLCSPHEIQVPGPLEYSFSVGPVDLTVVQGTGTVVVFSDTGERIEL